MNTKAIFGSMFLLIVIIFGVVYLSNRTYKLAPENKKNVPFPSEVRRQTIQFPLSLTPGNAPPSISASKLPEFVLNLADKKFESILNSSTDQIRNLAKATIVRSAYTQDSLETEVSVDYDKKELHVRPEDIPNFKPGIYHLSLGLRTIEGMVNIEQDFTWGVIAVNTNKSIYAPGETAKIGIGVLNDKGETQCQTGFDRVDAISMTITDPTGKESEYSLKDGKITGSSECGPKTITNVADFQANYKTSGSGIYQMKISATVRGSARSITDYFKVDPDVPFDVERNSFPTRIYPYGIYPVSLTITPKEDYEGDVVDIVPASFGIEHISDNGILRKEGDFARIVWRLKLKAGVSTSISYFINFPKISPEFYLVGPLKIGTFQEARQWQIASDAINSTSGLVTYEDNGTQNTFYRLWSGTAYGTQASISSGASTPTNSKWFREVSSPKTGEKLVAVLDSDTTDVNYVYRWTGSAWVQDLRIVLTGVTTLNTSEALDIAYEELSGDALFVYSDGFRPQLWYRYYTSATRTWSASSSAGAPFESYKRWLRLKPQFGSDSILVAYQNNSQHVGAMIWDGASNTFGNQFAEDGGSATQTSGSRPVRSFDAGWETLSGDAVVFWGTTANNLIYRQFSGSSWTAETTAATGFTNDIAWVVAASDPDDNSNTIAIGTQEVTTPTCKMGIWNGSSMAINGNSYPCRSATVQRLIDVAFENTGGKAMWILNVSTAAGQMSWLTWKSSNPAGGFTQLRPELGTNGSALLESVQLTSDLNTTSMMALYVDSLGDLWDREWDGATWSGKPTTALFANIQGTGETCEAYGFGFDRNLETLVAYKWFNNVNNDTGAGLSALSDQNSSYTLTSANQQFRLRLLLYYPDSLLSSALRFYKLQYVDPGTGTCAAPTGGTPSTYTDVPTSGGSTISFASSGSLASGDNIATNSADPSYQGLLTQYQDFQKSNNFTNSRTNMVGNQVGIWDFSLIDNTPFDRIAQSYCFRVARSNDLVLQLDIYPQINTAAQDDVVIQGGSEINGGTHTNN